MFTLKIRPLNGETSGVVLPDEFLQRLNVGEGDTLYLAEDECGGWRLTTVSAEFDDQISAAREGMTSYRSTLRDLAN